MWHEGCVWCISDATIGRRYRGGGFVLGFGSVEVGR